MTVTERDERLEVDRLLSLREIGDRLRALRGETPRSTVAKTVNISRSALQMYENGERMPRDEVKEALAAYYGTTVGALFFDEKCHEMRQNT